MKLLNNPIDAIINQLVDPPDLKTDNPKLVMLYQPDRFNKILTYWSKIFHREIPISVRDCGEQIVQEKLELRFIPFMEDKLEEMLPNMRTFPLIAENAIEFIELLQKTLPHYVVPTRTRNALIKGKLGAPNVWDWLRSKELSHS